MDWVLLIVLAGVIVAAGMRLSYYADVLSLKFGVSSSVMGALLVSFITSLPELTTTLGSVLTVDSPDMAIGNIFGSNLFNLSIIALCDIIFIRAGVFRNIARREALPAALSLGILAVATIGLLTPVGFTLFGLHFSLGSFLVVIGYVLFFIWMHKSGELEELLETDEALESASPSASGAIVAFGICSVLIVASGISLAVVGDRLAESTGMTHTFMGVLFLATATSLPELSVGLSAVRRGSYDLLAGTVIGSNVFNILVLAIADLFYARAPLGVPANLDWSNIFSAGCAMLATLLVIAAIAFKPRRPRPTLFFSVSIIAIYLLCLLLVFRGWV